MIQSPHLIRFLTFWSLVMLLSSSATAQVDALRECLATSAKSELQSHGTQRFQIHAAVGQSSPIRQGTAHGLLIGQGFIQPVSTRSIAYEPEPLELDVFPNPTSGIVQLRSIHADRLYIDISVYDMTGRAIWARSTNLEGFITIDLSIIDAGIYLLRVHDGERVFTSNIHKL